MRSSWASSFGKALRGGVFSAPWKGIPTSEGLSKEEPPAMLDMCSSDSAVITEFGYAKSRNSDATSAVGREANCPCYPRVYTSNRSKSKDVTVGRANLSETLDDQKYLGNRTYARPVVKPAHKDRGLRNYVMGDLRRSGL
jgi:hypothetical protein